MMLKVMLLIFFSLPPFELFIIQIIATFTKFKQKPYHLIIKPIQFSITQHEVIATKLRATIKFIAIVTA